MKITWHWNPWDWSLHWRQAHGRVVRNTEQLFLAKQEGLRTKYDPNFEIFRYTWALGPLWIARDL